MSPAGPGTPASTETGTVRVEVALPVPVARTFTYETASDAARPGMRVRVPFAGRRLVGWVVGPGRDESLRELRAIERVLDDEPVLDATMLRLCRWIASYYLAPLGVVLRAALPAVLSDRARTSPPVKTERMLRLIAELPSLTRREEVFGRSHRQRECFEYLESVNGSARIADLTGRHGYSTSVIRGLVDRGLAEHVEWPVLRDPFADVAVDPAPIHTLTPAQAEAVSRVCDAAHSTRNNGAESRTRPFLLFGVTGSGKTQVYIELLHEVVGRQGRGAIVLVPEIALTPQTVARFRAHFGDDVAVLHSALSDGERYDAWRALRSGARRIAIGARSAVFAPVRDLGAIVLDEEHESSYKQGEAPRYNAREVAIVRAQLAGAVCVLGSATPALETWRNASTGKFVLLELRERAAGQPLPPVRVIDLRRRDKAGDRSSRILSPPLVAAVSERLARQDQIILLLNRRGYATFVQCRSCGYVFRCRDCNVSLTWHRARRRLVCHYCFREEATPVTCSSCGSADLAFLGVGTEQVEREVADTFPGARIARMDVDTTSARWSHHEILDRVGRREVDILLGTQMIAKGLDFPGVTLVGVVNADVAMNLPDFRATERTFQLLTQVAGRAGRGLAGGEVLIQTSLPDHYAIRNAVQHDYRAFADREIEERLAARYPPHTRMTNAVLSGLDERAVQDAVEAAADRTREMLREQGIGDVVLTGPAPCPIDRIRGRWRWHFLLRSERARPLATIGRLLQSRHTVAAGRAELRLVLDRDPVTLL
ncbi:MAG: primosomal protein N' [Gemmatimonadetes bacterium]|nr:primosomal protein N' [Gemmatimonadota bacterium]